MAGQFIMDNVLRPIVEQVVAGLMNVVTALLQTVSAVMPDFQVVQATNGLEMQYGGQSIHFAMQVSPLLNIELLVNGQLFYRITGFFLLPMAAFAFEETLSVQTEELPALFMHTYGLIDLVTALAYGIQGNTGKGFDNSEWGPYTAGYLQYFLLMTLPFLGMFVTLPNDTKAEFATSMFILHGSAVVAFSFMTCSRNCPRQMQ